MICLICRQADVLDGFTSIPFERGELHLIISNVPARVCPRCGEGYIDEKIAVHLLRAAVEASKAGIVENVSEYNSLTRDV